LGKRVDTNGGRESAKNPGSGTDRRQEGSCIRDVDNGETPVISQSGKDLSRKKKKEDSDDKSPRDKKAESGADCERQRGTN